MPRTELDINYQLNGERRVVTTRLSDGSLISDQSEVKVAYGHSEVRHTTNTPGYHSMSKAERESLPMNPFSYSTRQVTHPNGNIEMSTPSNDTFSRESGLLAVGTNLEPRGITAAIKAVVDNESALNSLHKLKDMKVNLGVAAAERRKTADFILDTAKRLGDSYRFARKGQFRNAAEELGYAHDSLVRRASKQKTGLIKGSARDWLAWQYAVKPTVADVYGAAETLAASRFRPTRYRVSSSKSHRWSFTDFNETWRDVPVRRSEFGIYSRKYVYHFAYSHEHLHALSSMGITNPVSWAWELLPWSFVGDWFINIGKYIDAFDAALGLTFEKGCVTTFEKARILYRANATVQNAYGGYTHVIGGARKTHVDCVRGPLSGFHLPQPPMWNPEISINRGISAAALIRQRLKL